MPASGNEKRSWKSTRIVELLGIDYPIIQAPFGGFPSQQLTAAVSNLGGLGSLRAVTLGSSAITEAIEEIRSLTTKPFAINLWVSTSDREAARIESDIIQSKIRGLARYYAELGIEPPSQVESKPQDFEVQVRAAVDARPAVLSFIYGIPPAEILDECRKHAIRTIGTATTPEEAVALEEAGFDSIVASGFEGGGHRGSFLRPAAHSLMGGLSLIPQVVDAVSVPVIAAGGIADGRGVVAAHALGAEAVQIGTAFVSCVGSGASAAYRSALSSPAAKNTGLTEAFTGRLARGVRSRLMDELADVNDPALPFPLQHALIQTVVGPASVREIPELMTVWAGFPCCIGFPLVCTLSPIPRRNRKVHISLSSFTMAAFPGFWAGRLPHCVFRGLLSVHSRYGLHTCQVTYMTLYTGGFSRFVTSTTAPIATGWSDLAGRDSHPLRNRAFARRTKYRTLRV